jgi:hypothetical protein
LAHTQRATSSDSDKEIRAKDENFFSWKLLKIVLSKAEKSLQPAR